MKEKAESQRKPEPKGLKREQQPWGLLRKKKKKKRKERGIYRNG